jgi:hypothetical protein
MFVRCFIEIDRFSNVINYYPLSVFLLWVGEGSYVGMDLSGSEQSAVAEM